MRVSDNFVRPNGALGGSWASVIPNHAEFQPWTGVPAGNILINNNGYGPDATNGLDAAVLWNGSQSFVSNQWACAQFKTVAAYTAVLSITAVSGSGSTWTYTYTVFSGSVANAISGGALYVLISGMQNAGNNGTFTATVFGSGTFTVTNASGVAESGSSGTGNCPSDSGAGIMVRGTGTSAGNLNGYFFHAGTNSFSGDGRRAYYELWKVINGVGALVAGNSGILSGSTLPVVGDTIAVSAIGSTITAYKNGVAVGVTDTSIASGGVPGLWSFAVSGQFEYVWSKWSDGGTTQFGGNNGTTLNNFQAGDTNYTTAQLVSNTFLNRNQLLSDSFPYANGDLHTANANWVEQSGTLAVSSNKVFSNAAGINLAYRSDVTPNNDQWAEATMVIGGSVGTQNCGPSVRQSTSAATCYTIQAASDTLRISKDVSGTFSVLSTAGSVPVNGDVLTLVVNGTSLILLQNGVPQTSATDNAITSGNAGLFGAGNATVNGFSSWRGGNFPLPSNISQGTGQVFFIDTTNGIFPVLADGQGFVRFWENSFSWGADQYSEGVLTSTSAPVQLSGPSVRTSNSANTAYVFSTINSTTVALYKVINGVATQLNTATHNYVAGDTYRIEAYGPLVVGKINGVTQLTSVDLDIASGQPGYVAFNAGSSVSKSMKNWAAGTVTNLTSGGGTSTTNVQQLTGPLFQLNQL